MKKILSLVLVFSIILLMPTTVFATESNDDETIDASKKNAIISQAISLDETKNVEDKNFEVVSLVEKNISPNTLGTAASSNAAKALQAVNVDGEIIEVTTIIPYKCLPSGELVNSFKYASTQTRYAGTNSIEFVDVTVTATATFAVYSGMVNIAAFYRHSGVEAYWSSDVASASVTDMNVVFMSAGELYEYPECVTGDMDDAFVSDYYDITSEIEERNPVENRVYIDGSNIMPLDRVIYCPDYWNHGGSVYIALSYSVNGRSYQQDVEYFVFGERA